MVAFLQQDKTMQTSLNKRVKRHVRNESDVGIVKFYNTSNVKFEGILKQNTFDFIVQEIDLEENVVQLKDMPFPTTAKDDIVDESSFFNHFQSHEILQQYYKKEELLTLQNDLQKILQVKSGDLLLKLITDKSHRKSIHSLFKTCNKLYTKAKDNLIQICYGKESKGGRAVVNWKELGGEYLEFCLIKSNVDTIQAVHEIANRSKLQPKFLSYAGTKDKRACTTQLVRCHRVEYKRLANIPFNFAEDSIKRIKLCNFRYVDGPLRLGDCFGNRFVVVLRDVKLPNTENENSELEAVVHDSFTALKENGFINYFGMQRFGNSSVGTEALGKLVILQDWKALINLILDPRVDESEQVANARLVYKETKDCEKAYNAFPLHFNAERSVLSHLKIKPSDYKGAFERIPRNLRTMYAHAYQSYIWNSMATKRIEKYGFNIQIGDLVISHKEDIERNTRGVKKFRPVVVDESNIVNYSIFDVVLTVPGSDTIFPTNMESDYLLFLESEGIDMSNWGANPQLNISGTYRHLVSKAIDLKWSIHKYIEMEPLHSVFGEELVISDDLVGDKYAIKVQVSLKTSNYMTMMLREVLSLVDREILES